MNYPPVLVQPPVESARAYVTLFVIGSSLEGKGIHVSPYVVIHSFIAAYVVNMQYSSGIPHTIRGLKRVP